MKLSAGEYVFCGSDGAALGDGAVNTILSAIVKADPADGFYRQLTPEKFLDELG